MPKIKNQGKVKIFKKNGVYGGCGVFDQLREIVFKRGIR